MDDEEREVSEWTLEDLMERWKDATPAKIRRKPPLRWRLKRAWQVLRWPDSTTVSGGGIYITNPPVGLDIRDNQIRTTFRA